MAFAKFGSVSESSRLRTVAKSLKCLFRHVSTSLGTPSPLGKADELFEYTSGRWMLVIHCHRIESELRADRFSYNEPLRKRERYLKFDISALCRAVASSERFTDVISLEKFAEGGFNRIFEATCRDGRQVLARLPYPSTVPKHYTVASEVATMEYLRSNQIPVPRVYGWSSTMSNDVGAEYIIMEKLEGKTLGDLWFSLSFKERYKVVEQIVQLERKLFSLQIPASGSIYFPNDLTEEERSLSAPFQSHGHEYCIGPLTHYSWWHRGRSSIECDRGPCKLCAIDNIHI